ncbi:hypothetical protein H2201_009006, partial [Coniosporium apollinis]
APPKWTPPTLPIAVSKDSGVYFIDTNSSKVPSCPFTPLFQALHIMQPDFNFTPIDILTSRNSLRKLLNFVSNNVKESFRIDLQLINNTTLALFRHERNARQIIRGSGDSGYGHSFESAFTTPEPGLEDSCAYHRALRYKLGDLDCVIQFEVDAWCDDGVCAADSTATPGAAGKLDVSLVASPRATHHAVSTVGAIASSLSQLSITETPFRQQQHAPSGGGGWAAHHLPVSRREGRSAVAPSQLAEIKTRGGRKPLQLGKMLPQLWFGRTPHLLVGMHEAGDGTFGRVDGIDAAARFPAWEAQNQGALRALVGVLARLREVVRSPAVGESGVAVVVCDCKVKPASLDVLLPAEGSKRRVVPEEFVREFWRAGS